VRTLVSEAHQQAKALLTQYRDQLDGVAELLLEKETITREEFEAVFPTPQPKHSGTPVMLAANN